MTRAIELLRPAAIRAALAAKSLIYLPLGTIEWHCEHLPVGLDALTAHGLCLAAAELSGGLVWPALHYGTGGSHSKYPWTVMMDEPELLKDILRLTIRRLGEMGVERVVLFSGHFADEQLDLIDSMADEHRNGDAPLVAATAVNRFDLPDYSPDHAGRFETTLLAGLLPGAVDLGTLPRPRDGDDPGDRHAPSHPLWGVIGADPRLADLSDGPRLAATIARKLAAFAAGYGRPAAPTRNLSWPDLGISGDEHG